MRVTRKVLQEQVDTLNGIVSGGYELDENLDYGGYCLTVVTCSYHVCGSKSAKEMYSYLEAAIDFTQLALSRKSMRGEK